MWSSWRGLGCEAVLCLPSKRQTQGLFTGMTHIVTEILGLFPRIPTPIGVSQLERRSPAPVPYSLPLLLSTAPAPASVSCPCHLPLPLSAAPRPHPCLCRDWAGLPDYHFCSSSLLLPQNLSWTEMHECLCLSCVCACLQGRDESPVLSSLPSPALSHFLEEGGPSKLGVNYPRL